MLGKYSKIKYHELNSKQKERFNFQKASSALADFGFITMILSDDYLGADFLAIHKDGDVLKVQLKARMTISEKYRNKDLYLCFPVNEETEDFYLFPHDEVLNFVLNNSNVAQTESWAQGTYSWKTVSGPLKNFLDQYKLKASIRKSA